MATKKISALPACGPLAGTEKLPLVQGATTVSATLDELPVSTATAAAVAALAATVATDAEVAALVTPLATRTTALEGRRLDQVPVPTTSVALNAQRMTGASDPIGAQDVATRAFVLANAGPSPTNIDGGDPGSIYLTNIDGGTP